MKLTDAQIAELRDLTGAEPLTDAAPALGDLIDAYGDHTFYLARDGLIIWEFVGPDGASGTGEHPAVAVLLAGWNDDSRTHLVPQEPRVTDIFVPLSRAN